MRPITPLIRKADNLNMRIWILALALIMVGCGKEGPAPPAWLAPFTGTWLSDCQPSSPFNFKQTMTISADGVTRHTTDYADTGCTLVASTGADVSLPIDSNELAGSPEYYKVALGGGSGLYGLLKAVDGNSFSFQGWKVSASTLQPDNAASWSTYHRQ